MISVYRKKSFTLIEVLVAVTIFAILAGGLAGVFFSGIKIWQKLEEASIDDDLYIAMETFSSALRQNLKHKSFQAKCRPDGIDFVSNRQGKVHKLSFYFKSAKKAFFMKSADYRSIFLLKDIAVKERNLTSVDKMSFLYLVLNEKGGTFSWRSQYDGAPIAVRLSAQRDGRDFAKVVFLPR